MTAISDSPILSDDQKSFLARYSISPLCEIFYLTGGTALSAFYLQHRLSEDLDFFTERDVRIEEVLDFVKSLPGLKDVQYERKYDRKIFLLRYPEARTMKAEFTRYPFSRLEAGVAIGRVRVDSLRDILANKLMAMTDRLDAKDYIDLYCAFRTHPELDLQQLVEDTAVKFGVKGVQHILKARFLGPLPPLGVLRMRGKLDTEDLARFFADQAREWIVRSTEEP